MGKTIGKGLVSECLIGQRNDKRSKAEVIIIFFFFLINTKMRKSAVIVVTFKMRIRLSLTGLRFLASVIFGLYDMGLKPFSFLGF